MTRALSMGVTYFLLSASFAFAQFTPTGLERPLDLSLSPQYPAPGATVLLSIKTYALDLNRSMVVWYANNKEFARGSGVTEARIVAGTLGTETHIVVVAEDDEGLVAFAEANIRPAEVDLLWEAESYTPPFFKGRALPGASTPIHAQALVRFQAGDALVAEKDIVYTWRRNGAIAAEGRGRSSVVLPGPLLFGTDTIRVTAVSADRTLSGEATALIPSTDPFVVLYENHPLFGVLFHRSIEPGATTRETEQKVTAVPYFARIQRASDAGLAYEWTVNGSRIEPDPNEPQTLTITAEGYQGPADIALTLTSSSDVFLRAAGAWQIIFGDAGTNFFSGLNPFGGN